MIPTTTVYNTTTVPVFVCGAWIPAESRGFVPSAEVDGELVQHYLTAGILSLQEPPTRVDSPTEPAPEPKARKTTTKKVVKVSSKAPEAKETVEEHVVSSESVKKAPAAKTTPKKRTRTRRKTTAKK